MKHGSLFSGIGGFDLAAQWMGWDNLFHCEMNPFGQKVLNHYWPDAELFTDITKSDFTKYANRIDILTGGFPCQPYSHAGKRLGKEDERHLWPEMLRAIREIQPTWVVGENVSGLITWNGGLVFHEVQTDLEAEGYEVFPVILPACAVNAPHRRDRVWFIAYSERNGRQKYAGSVEHSTGKNEGNTRQQIFDAIEPNVQTRPTINPNDQGGTAGFGQVQKEDGEIPEWYNDSEFGNAGAGITSNPTSQGREEREPNNGRTDSAENRTGMDDRFERFGSDRFITNTVCNGQPGQEYRQKESGRFTEKSIPNDWQNFPTEPPVCGKHDGISPGLVGITVSKHRNESIKAYGNAIVPQVALQIFKAIQAMVTQQNQSPLP